MVQRGTRPVLEDSFIADEAITRYAAVLYTSTEGHVSAPAAAKDERVAGIAQEAATTSGDVIRIMQIGKSKVIAGASASIGDQLAIHDIVGRVSRPTAFVSGDGYVGYYEEAPSASGDIVTAFVNVRDIIR